MSIPMLPGGMITVTPAGAAQAYATAAGGVGEAGAGEGGAGEAGGFGQALGEALRGVVQAGREADAQSMKAIAGGGNVTEVVTAVSRAELALQSAVSIRDKMITAYQDIMRMPI